jgi:ribosomal-protein-alanine N-acetyltransferase
MTVGRRVLLRPPEAGDSAAFLRMVRRSRRLHRPWVYPPGDARSFRRYVARARSDPRGCGFLACLLSDGTIVGAVNLSEIVRGNFRSAYLGYYGSADHEGSGLMTEAVRLALRHAFEVLRLHRVEANIQPQNRRSIALARRCGFKKEGLSPRYLKIGGRWRDHQRWALLAESWRRRPFRAGR